MPRFFILLALTACLTACDGPSDSAHGRGLQAFATGALEKLKVLETPIALPDVMISKGLEETPVAAAEVMTGPALVNLWATWCAPCVKELPSLAALAEDTGVPVYALSIERGRTKKIAEFLDEKGAGTLTLLRDPGGRLPQALGIGVLPVTLVIDANGQIIGQLLGEAEWDSPEARAFVAAVGAG